MSEERRPLLARLRASVLARNAAALYGVHVVGMLLPLVTIPYLARVLRPEGWGVVVFAQSFSAWLALVLEYGFYLSATRLVARVRDDPRRSAEVVADVLGARLLLLVLTGVAAAAALAAVPVFREHPAYLAWGWAVAVAQGFSPFWYFQGTERMRGPAALEMGTRVLSTAGIFLLVRDPGDGWLVLALQAGAGLLAVAGMSVWLYREVDFRRPTLRGAVAMLREAAGLFVFRSASGMYVQLNSFILGVLAGPQVVAYFGGAERIVRAAINLLHPASQALYPRISHLAAHDREGAGRLVRLSLLLVGGLGVAMGAVAWLAAPLLVRVLLGPGYEAAVPVLRVLALLPPTIALGTVLGIQWALPMGLDRPFYRLVVAAGVLNVGLAVLLAPRYGAIGMAVSVVLADVLVSGGLLRLAWRHEMKVLRVRRWRRPAAARTLGAAAAPPAREPWPLTIPGTREET